MGEQRRRTERAMVSVLIPERGRPEMLERLIQSLCTTAGADQRYEILVAVDDDDPAWKEHPPHAPWSSSRPVLWFHGPRPLTLGEKLNNLARQAQGDILWFIANDYVMETEGWPTKFREAVAKLPNGIGVPFPHDELHAGHAAFPIITRKIIDAVGFMFPPWFPYWYIDTWVDQVGIMLGQHHEIDVVVRAPEGRGLSHGLKDVTFWATFFNEMLPFRARDALGLARLAYGEDTNGYAEVKERLAERTRLCAARTSHLITIEFADVWESHAASAPGPDYGKVKAHAEEMSRNLRAAQPRPTRVALCCPSGRTWEAATGNSIAALSAHSAAAGINLSLLNVQSSQITHGRNTSVKIAMQEQCDYIFWVDSDMKFPPDALLRLLAHGKDIVGATYCKRVKPYATLGRLLGPHPDTLNDGLYEAELLPGGLLLVRLDVYRTLKWPWYAETFVWAGDDGLDSFRNLLADYFTEPPPDDVVRSLSESSFGTWIKDHYTVGAGDYPMFSEDLFFITKARRNGYRAWCDLRLTNETVHLGEIEVTCTLPANTLRLVDAAE